jgi:hypothetical protein
LLSENSIPSEDNGDEQIHQLSDSSSKEKLQIFKNKKIKLGSRMTRKNDTRRGVSI